MEKQVEAIVKEVSVEELGLRMYKEVWDYQENLFSKTVKQKTYNRDVAPELREPTKDHLLFCEHHPVITIGKSGDINHLLLEEDALLERGIQFHKVNRGGDITCHEPEQIVVYPIIDLDHFQGDIHKYMRDLEEVIIRTLAEYGLQGERVTGATGVWLNGDDPLKARKICAMGVRTSRWVTMHGLALNVNNDLSLFNYVVPCGIENRQVTSLQKELGRKVDKEEVKALIKRYFSEVFGARLTT